MMATRENHLSTVQLLLAKGADPNRGNQDGATALSWARRANFYAIEQALTKGGARDQPR